MNGSRSDENETHQGQLVVDQVVGCLCRYTNGGNLILRDRVDVVCWDGMRMRRDRTWIPLEQELDVDLVGLAVFLGTA